ncbi:MAG: hypothetical protein EP330_11440 [Deltaproteobacteria bacterium]|nr:MAG: hypothetical protein EP330_11440 [Deltaproteobacteria bacterium]
MNIEGFKRLAGMMGVIVVAEMAIFWLIGAFPPTSPLEWNMLLYGVGGPLVVSVGSIAVYVGLVRMGYDPPTEVHRSVSQDYRYLQDPMHRSPGSSKVRDAEDE